MQNVKICLMDERSEVIENTDINFAEIGNVLWDIEDCEKVKKGVRSYLQKESGLISWGYV